MIREDSVEIARGLVTAEGTQPRCCPLYSDSFPGSEIYIEGEADLLSCAREIGIGVRRK